MDKIEQVIAKGTKRLVSFGQRLVSFGQFVKGPQWQPNFEEVTSSLVERFSLGIFPSPHAFSDEEIAVIEQWAGDDDKDTFGGYENDPQFQSMGDKIIDEYKLDVSAGENTWPKFAAILKARKKARTH